MAMELKMINPGLVNESSIAYRIDEYKLFFDGFEGLGNVDDDGDEFYYLCSYWRDLSLSNEWNFIAERIYEDDHTLAWFTKAEADYVKSWMRKEIENEWGVKIA